MNTKLMTTEQIERLVEMRTDAADRALMSYRMTQAEYNLHMRAIDRWAERMFKNAQ